MVEEPYESNFLNAIVYLVALNRNGFTSAASVLSE